jgi:uncharacterized membrane protein YcaP (DUF421 family)
LEEAIQAFEWKRVLIGDEPPLFFLEILFRTLIIYVYALVLLRWLGSRTIGQLSTIEFLLVFALGSAVGDAMFYPDVPLLQAMLVITVVVVANRALDTVIANSPKAERAIDGVAVEAIRNGVVNRKFIEGRTLSESELFQQLREHGLEHLGQVARAYLETDGALTVFKADDERPGLPITPPWEIEVPSEVNPATAVGPIACKRCGNLGGSDSRVCANCGSEVWVQARGSDGTIASRNQIRPADGRGYGP